MDPLDKIEALTRDARFEVCTPGETTGQGKDDFHRWVSHAVLPNGQTFPLFKVLLSNACERDCAYCANRCGRDFRRTSFRPDELAATFYQMWRAKLVRGLFLSSAVRGGSALTMEREIATVEILRTKYKYPGYIHLKLMPGIERAAVERAVQLADRVSANLEAPNPERLARLTGKKDFYRELLIPLGWVKEIRQEDGGKVLSSGCTTQLVVGASDESDVEILTTAAELYNDLGLTRVYYSAFRPVPDTPLQNHPATPGIRQHRLYQSDFLLRHYGFTTKDIVFGEHGNLPEETDPKTLAALHQPERFPVEINMASREELLRVPGIGPRSASRIVQWRGEGSFRSLADLKKTGVSVRRAAPFILLDGQQPPFQLSLF